MERREKEPFSITSLLSANPGLARTMCWKFAAWDHADAAGRHVQFGLS